MRIRPFTPEDYPAIVDVHKSLHIVWPDYPPGAQAWAEADRNRSPKCRHQRWVAVDGTIVDGAAGGCSVVGFSSYGQHIDDYHPQRFYVNVEVRPQYQLRGIGSALYEEVVHGLPEFDTSGTASLAFTRIAIRQSFRVDLSYDRPPV